MIAIDKLRGLFERQFDLTVIQEPNNAMARRSVRIAQTGMQLSPLSKTDAFLPYQPYELLLNLQVSLRLSGGNAGDFLTSQIIEHGIMLGCSLADDLIVLRDVGEDLPLIRAASSESGGFLQTRIVGDAELTDARRIGSNYENGAQNSFEHSGEMYIYTEVWACTLVMTVHRLFDNPRLRQVIYTHDPDGHQLTVPPVEHSKES